MARPKVIIFQGQIPPYRIPLFNRLADCFELTVVHGGGTVDPALANFATLCLADRKLGPFHLQPWREIAGLIDRHDVSFGMFDLSWPAYVLPVLSARLRRKHVLWGHRYGPRWLANRLRTLLLRRAAAILMYGTEHHAEMIGRGIDAGKIFVAQNTVLISNHADFSAHKKNSLLFVGRIQDRKRLDLALAGFAAVAPRIDPRIRFDIVGDGPLKPQLVAQARALGIADRVIFHGAMHDDAELAPLFARAIAYVSPGPVGLSVLHSFAYGVPVLTLREGYHGPEFHNLANGENALIADDDDAFAEAMVALCTDADLARRLGHAAYQLYAGSRQIEHMVRGFVDCAAFIMSRGAGGGR